LFGGTVDTTVTGVVGVTNTGASFPTFCSGTLLAPNLVMVPRSCVSQLVGGGGTSCATSIYEAPTGSMDVYADTTIAIDAGARLHGDKVLVPPDDHVCGNDIALIILSGSFPATVATPLVPRLEVPPTKGETYTALGYGGVDPAGAEAGTRRHLAALAVACVDSCDSIGATAGKEIGGAAGTCPGDQGGPAVDATGKVFALFSRGSGGCVAGLYTRVDAFAPFLKGGALEAATKGGYPPPAWATSATDAGADATGDAIVATDSSAADTGGTDSEVDALTPADAAAALAASAEESSGCGCLVAGSTTSASPFAIAGVLAGVLSGLLARRRMRYETRPHGRRPQHARLRARRDLVPLRD
ncbi:MAG: trypsin-like serine protease, partial [Polyangiales bacterium]